MAELHLSRFLPVLGILVVLSGCGATPADHGSSAPAADSSSAPAGGDLDPDARYLLDAAAKDFREHDLPAVRVRHVRFGRIANPGGEALPVLCGEVQTAKDSTDWTPFATIRTGAYEQWIGDTFFCGHEKAAWEKGDLTAALQSRLDSLP